MSSGELNYKVTMLCDDYLVRGGMSYDNINAVIGVLACASAEFYRRIAAPYENTKIAINGDVFSADNLPAADSFVTLPDAIKASDERR